MLGAGTIDLAVGIAQVARHYSSAQGLQGLWILDSTGQELACAGSAKLDGELSFEVHEGELLVAGLPKGRKQIIKSIEVSGDDILWLVLTSTEGEDDSDELDTFAVWMADHVSREVRRDYESEDTTEHLLGLFEQIRAVHDLADQLPHCESLREKCKLCLSSLMLAVGPKECAVVLKHEGANDLYGFLRGETEESYEAISVPYEGLDDGPLFHSMNEGRAIYGPVDSLIIPAGSLESRAEDSLLVVPIHFGRDEDQSALGAILLFDRAAGSGRARPYGSPEAEHVASVSVLLGLIVGTQRQTNAEKELQIASSIQETLIPKSPPNWPGLDIASRNLTAGQVGGDYLDFLNSKDGSKQVLIADVSGHNMASAMAMIMGRTQFKSVAANHSSPSEIMALVASGLFQDLVRNELFITVFLLSLSKEENGVFEGKFTNAGHNPPLLLRSDGTVSWLEGGGPMVGFMPDIEYDELPVRLETNDIVVLYTDGVTEASDQDGRMFEQEGLVEAVEALKDFSASEILEGIYASVTMHSGLEAEDDDITVIVLKVLEPEAEANDIVNKGNPS